LSNTYPGNRSIIPLPACYDCMSEYNLVSELRNVAFINSTFNLFSRWAISPRTFWWDYFCLSNHHVQRYIIIYYNKNIAWWSNMFLRWCTAARGEGIKWPDGRINPFKPIFWITSHNLWSPIKYQIGRNSPSIYHLYKAFREHIPIICVLYRYIHTALTL